MRTYTTTRCTLMGIVHRNNFPLESGNHFWIMNLDTQKEYKVINMFKQNFNVLTSIIGKQLQVEYDDSRMIAKIKIIQGYENYFHERNY